MPSAKLDKYQQEQMTRSIKRLLEIEQIKVDLDKEVVHILASAKMNDIPWSNLSRGIFRDRQYLYKIYHKKVRSYLSSKLTEGIKQS